MSRVGYFLGPLLIFLTCNYITVVGLKKKFGQCLPITMMIQTLFVYGSGLVFHTFNVGILIVGLFSLIGLFLFLFYNKNDCIKKNYYSIGFYIFLTIYMIFLIVDFNRFFNKWDEWMHWGKMVKEMIRLDNFYTIEKSNLIMHKDYPPFIQCFQLLWCKFSLRYSESRLTSSLHIFEISLLVLPLCEKIKNNTVFYKIVYTLASMFIALFIIWNFDMDSTFPTIYLDILLPIMYIYIIGLIHDYYYYFESNSYLFFIIISEFSFVLIKQMSIPFILLIWFYFIAKKIKSKIIFSLNDCIKSLSILLSPIISFLIWKFYVAKMDISGQFDFDRIHFNELLNILFHRGGTDLQKNTLKMYVNKLLTCNLSTGNISNITYFSLLFFSTTILFIMAMWMRNEVYTKDFVIYLAIILLGRIGYGITMMVLYLFCFSPDEMKTIAQYTRYMNTYNIAEALFLLLILYNYSLLYSKKIIDIKKIIFTMIVFFAFTNPLKISYLIPQCIYGEEAYNFRMIANRIQNNSDSGDTILIISRENNKYSKRILYYLEDRNIANKYLYKDISKIDISDDEFWEKFINDIDNYELLYVEYASESVNSKLGNRTPDNELYNNTIYKISGNKLICLE